MNTFISVQKIFFYLCIYQHRSLVLCFPGSLVLVICRWLCWLHWFLFIALLGVHTSDCFNVFSQLLAHNTEAHTSLTVTCLFGIEATIPKVQLLFHINATARTCLLCHESAFDNPDCTLVKLPDANASIKVLLLENKVERTHSIWTKGPFKVNFSTKLINS